MKRARLGDFKRALREGAAGRVFKLQRFVFADIPTLGSGEVPLACPIVVLAGPNGAGKTTLLRAIWAAAQHGDAATDESNTLKLSSGNATLYYEKDADQRTSQVKFSGGAISGGSDLGVDVFHVNPGAEALSHQHLFCGYSDPTDLINGVGQRVLSEISLAEVKYISRRDYREIKSYEIDFNGDFVPFFEVAYGTERYDSRTMGAGEIATLYMWWLLDRSPENAILLLEEPETFLSPACQEALIEHVTVLSVKKKLTIIVTSHSPKIILSAPTEGQIFLHRIPGSVRIETKLPSPSWLETIGISVATNVIGLVEDQAAALFTRRILERYNPALSRRIEIQSRGGDGEVVKLIKALGGQFKAISVVGIFDGDIRDTAPKEVRSMSTFLPGDQPIERMFRNVVQERPSLLETAIGATDLSAMLSGIQGVEDHDWYEELSSGVGLSRDQLFPILFNIWHEEAGNSAACRETVAQIEQLLSDQLRA